MVDCSPLAGIRVLSLAGHLPGPCASLLLADLGAEVTWVERRDGGDPLRGVPHLLAALTRGCRSLALDLKDAADRDLLLSTGATTDVVLEGFRPGVADRLGLGPTHFREVNPDIVYLSLSGFGQDGPYAERPAHDLVSQAVAGALPVSGGAPVRQSLPAVPWADLAGGVFAAVGVLAALLERARGGPARTVDVSLTDALTALLAPVIVNAGAGGPPGLLPPIAGYGLYRTRDDVLVAITVAHEDRPWSRLCHALDLPELAEHTAAERSAQHDRLDTAVCDAVAATDWATLEKRLSTAEAPFARVRTPAETLQDPHVLFRGVVAPTEDGSVRVRQPIRFDGVAPNRADEPVPALGQHNPSLEAER